MSASCVSPCSTCTLDNFYSCTSCENQSIGQILTGGLCLYEPTFYYQITTTATWLLFIIPVLVRKRCVVLIKILDCIQIASYFKFIKGMAYNREIWLYLSMRGWGDFSQGWTFLSNDYPLPIWTNQQGIINKMIRIAVIWVAVCFFTIIIGFLRTVFDDKSLTFGKFLKMNFANAASFAFYITLQDLAFICANALLYPVFNDMMQIIGFCLGAVFAIGILFYLFWVFYRINFKDTQQKYYYYKYFFLFSFDYDLFPTYELLSIPRFSKQIKKYSNLRVLDMIKKISYSFLIVAYLTDPAYTSSTYLDEVYQIFAFLLFFEILWYIILPFDMSKQYLQFIVMFLATGITFYLLFGPWYINNSLINTIMVLVLFGLGLISFILEGCLDIYKLIPIDLYDLGTKIVIEDARLLREIAMRRKQQEQIEKKLRKFQQENEKMKYQLENKKQEEDKPENDPKYKEKQKSENNVRQDSQISLNRTQPKEFYEPVKIEAEQFEKQSMDSEEMADLYKVDELKRRKVYQWNRQKPFSYSSKIQE